MTIINVTLHEQHIQKRSCDTSKVGRIAERWIEMQGITFRRAGKRRRKGPNPNDTADHEIYQSQSHSDADGRRPEDEDALELQVFHVDSWSLPNARRRRAGLYMSSSG